MVTDTGLDEPAIGRADSPAVARGRQALLLLLLIVLSAALALYRTADRDLFIAHEARAARVARHMLASGAWPAGRPSPWLVPQFSADAPPGLNYQKPPLYYWAVAGASAVCGEVTNLTVRLPSIVSLVALVVIVFYLGKALVSVRTGFIAGLVLLSTPKVLWWSRAGVLDPMLAACVAGSLLFFVRARLGATAVRGGVAGRERDRACGGAAGSRSTGSGQAPTRRAGRGEWQYWLFWALAGLGTLVKATSLVVPLLVVGLYLLVRMREEGFWRPLWRLKPITGPLVLLAVAAPWHIAAHVATAGEFSRVYWGVHVLGRATGTGPFEDSTYWWYYFPAMARDLFPWVVFLPGALVQPWRRVSRDHLGRLLFPGVWFVGSFVFFSAVSFRKDEYLLVAYPGAALLIGYFLDYYLGAHRQEGALRKWVEAALTVVAVTAFLLALGFVLVALSGSVREHLFEWFHNRTDQATFAAVAELIADREWIAVLLAGPMMIGATASVVLIRRDRPLPTVALMVGTTALAFVLFVEMIVPVLGQARGLASFATVASFHARERGPRTRIFLAVGECHELAFMLHRVTIGLEVRPDMVGYLKQDLATGRPWLVVMDRKAYERGRWADPGIAWRLVDETPPGHRRPMVLLEASLETEGPGRP